MEQSKCADFCKKKKKRIRVFWFSWSSEYSCYMIFAEDLISVLGSSQVIFLQLKRKLNYFNRTFILIELIQQMSTIYRNLIMYH